MLKNIKRKNALNCYCAFGCDCQTNIWGVSPIHSENLQIVTFHHIRPVRTVTLSRLRCSDLFKGKEGECVHRKNGSTNICSIPMVRIFLVVFFFLSFALHFQDSSIFRSSFRQLSSTISRESFSMQNEEEKKEKEKEKLETSM